jgi:hypothetical protein
VGDEEKPEFQVVPALPERLTDGRDELNFAEFPLGTIAERIDPKTKTLVFEDQIFDKRRNQMITRRLTITGSDAHGLPTSTDDEVLLGLVQLAKLQRFESQKVFFSRYQLIQLLKWPVNGQSYARIDEALNRWVGVTLYYDRAWRDRDTNEWVDEKFHILERVKVYSDENERTRPKPHPNQGSFEFAASFFTWNEVVFRSFKSGNLKALDFDFVLGLRSSVTRRLYRFLDKRFFNVMDKRGLGGVLEFDMKTLAYEHVGLSRNTPTGDLKRKLGAAMDELAERQFLKQLPQAERFRKVKAGEWKVRFERAGPGVSEAQAAKNPAEQATATQPQAESASPLEAKLVQHGVSREKAAELVRVNPEALIAEKVEVLEALIAKNDKRVSSNPAGFLIASIEKRFSSPRDVETAGQREAREAAKAKRAQAAVEREQRKREREEAKEVEREQMIAKFWASLSSEMRAAVEADAIAKADRFQRDLVERGGLAGEAARKSILNAYALSELAAG